MSNTNNKYLDGENLSSALQHTKDYIDTQLGIKQDKTDLSLTTTDKTIVGAINEVNEKASETLTLDATEILTDAQLNTFLANTQIYPYQGYAPLKRNLTAEELSYDKINIVLGPNTYLSFRKNLYNANGSYSYSMTYNITGTYATSNWDLYHDSLCVMNVPFYNIPNAPTTDDTYVLKCIVSNGVPSYQWVSENPPL